MIGNISGDCWNPSLCSINNSPLLIGGITTSSSMKNDKFLFSVTECSDLAVPHCHTIIFRVALLCPRTLLVLFPFTCASLYLLDLPDLNRLTETVGSNAFSAVVWSVPNPALISSVWNTPFLTCAQTVTEASKAAWCGLLHYVKHSV